MGNRLFTALLWFLSISALLAPVIPPAAQDPISHGNISKPNPSVEQSNEDMPRYSVPQYLPCPDQTRTFGELSNSFSSAHLPSPSEITGSWVLIGSWLHTDSHPDLNCTGIMRGKAFEWVMLAQGYSLQIDMLGANQTSAFELGRKQDLTVALDLGGDSSPTLRCRLTRRHSLVCLGDTYYSGSEFRKIQVRCEPSTPTPKSNSAIPPVLCYPLKNE